MDPCYVCWTSTTRAFDVTLTYVSAQRGYLARQMPSSDYITGIFLFVVDNEERDCAIDRAEEDHGFHVDELAGANQIRT